MKARLVMKRSFQKDNHAKGSGKQGKIPIFFPGMRERKKPRDSFPGMTPFRVKKAGSALVAPSPPGPVEDQDGAARRWPEQLREEMTNFGNGQREQRRHRGWVCLLDGRSTSSCTDPRQSSHDHHHQRDEPVPGREPSDLVILQAHLFACLEAFLNFPPRSDGFHHLSK